MHDHTATGRIRVSPPLSAAEREHLYDVCDSGGTLRGTPTGRGDASVPFARLAWRPCARGCCLTWDGSERSVHAAATLGFLVDHLLRPGARAAGHQRFPDLTCDHVLDGVVVVRRHDDARPYVVHVRSNTVEQLEVGTACDVVEPRRRARREWPANVVALRPRRA